LALFFCEGYLYYFYQQLMLVIRKHNGNEDYILSPLTYQYHLFLKHNSFLIIFYRIQTLDKVVALAIKRLFYF